MAILSAVLPVNCATSCIFRTSGVPWASHTVSRKEKLSDFFTNMEKLEAQLQVEAKTCILL